ncbi:lasso RiPP family leader peptide-containing protein [Prauserella muralis]|nr:lasso RiPP family leader peptide-containing protein [Prauserella muralis]TWE11184.1 hypothetical protein FHX69_7403 [Prauserella muralis]
MQQSQRAQVPPYEPPLVTEVGDFGTVTEGQYSKSISDDGDAGGYWE